MMPATPTLAHTPASPAATGHDDDKALVQRIVQGDGTGFEALMRRHNRRLFRLARSLLRDAAEAEEALQEAYLSAWRALPRFRGEASTATWLSRLVVNECMARLRRQARRNNIVPMVRSADRRTQDTDEAMTDAPTGSGAEAPDAVLLRAQLRRHLERRIDELPQAFRTVFVLRCIEELSVEETAQCLSIPEATVRTRLFRARSQLRDTLAQDLDLAERDVFSFDGERCDRIVTRVLARLADLGWGITCAECAPRPIPPSQRGRARGEARVPTAG